MLFPGTRVFVVGKGTPCAVVSVHPQNVGHRVWVFLSFVYGICRLGRDDRRRGDDGDHPSPTQSVKAAAWCTRSVPRVDGASSSHAVRRLLFPILRRRAYLARCRRRRCVVVVVVGNVRGVYDCRRRRRACSGNERRKKAAKRTFGNRRPVYLEKTRSTAA